MSMCAGRCLQPPLLSAAALSGGDRGAVAGRHRLADPRHRADAEERPRDHGAGRRDRHSRRAACIPAEIDLAYDYLLLATGATYSYFGHDDWAPFAPGLKHIDDATEIRRRFLLAFEQAELMEDAAARARLLTFVIVGGGATGVEMAGAIAEVARRTLRHDFRRIDPRNSRIVLIEAGPRLLPSFPEICRITPPARCATWASPSSSAAWSPAATRRAFRLADGRIEAATVVWAAGVVASPAATWIGAAHDRAGRIKVRRRSRRVPGHPEIFAAGDTAIVFERDGQPVPGIAPAAKQMGAYVGEVIAARVTGRAAPPPFAIITSATSPPSAASPRW